MTDNERQEMLDRKRAGYTRRLRELRRRHQLARLSNRQRAVLTHLLVMTDGGISDAELRVLHSLTERGLVSGILQTTYIPLGD